MVQNSGLESRGRTSRQGRQVTNAEKMSVLTEEAPEGLPGLPSLASGFDYGCIIAKPVNDFEWVNLG